MMAKTEQDGNRSVETPGDKPACCCQAREPLWLVTLAPVLTWVLFAVYVDYAREDLVGTALATVLLILLAAGAAGLIGGVAAAVGTGRWQRFGRAAVSACTVLSVLGWLGCVTVIVTGAHVGAWLWP